MRRDVQKRHVGLGRMVLAVACALSLSACSNLPFDLPFDLPDLPKLPFELPDLSGLPNPLDLLGTSTSVDDARAAKANERPSELSIADLVSDGVLTVGLQTRSTSAPFYVTGSEGAIYGMDVDLASALADHLGTAVRFVSVEGADEALSQGSCDMVMNVDPSRAGSATVVGSYCESAAAFFSLGEERVATVDELRDKRVAVQEGSVSQGILNRSDLSMEQHAYVNLNEAFDALVAGEVDYVLCDAYSGAFLAAAHESVSFVGALSAPTPLGVAVPAGKENLAAASQQALDAILANGEMDVIRSTWVGGMPSISAEVVVQGVSISDAGTSTEESQDGSTAGANAVVPVLYDGGEVW